MKFEDALNKAMLQCILNAEQWIEDAKLLMKNGSLVHGSVLRDLAGEELAKLLRDGYEITYSNNEIFKLVKEI